ncbi:MAG: hypothetical protein Q9M43_10750 [Sulfurimonas sp.]|nr:hypothetical protein [Sulfurimonas sp.]
MAPIVGLSYSCSKRVSPSITVTNLKYRLGNIRYLLPSLGYSVNLSNNRIVGYIQANEARVTGESFPLESTNDTIIGG